MNANLLTLIHRRKSLYRRPQASKFKNVEFLNEFRRLRTQANNLYRQLRNIYYYSAYRQYSRNAKKLWAVISVVTGRKKTTQPAPGPQVLNNHYQTIAHDDEPGYDLPFDPIHPEDFCEFTEVTTETVH